MCTAATYRSRNLYFGRTLDVTVTYGEEIVFVPRRSALLFRRVPDADRHHAILGMAHISGNHPLYYDAVNEKGLAMAGLSFPGNACYHIPAEGWDNVASFELIPYILGQCASVREARSLLARTRLTDDDFSSSLPRTPLHWLLADREEAITVEPMQTGLMIYDNPVGILTNNPPFPAQMLRLSDFMSLSPASPENRLAPGVDLEQYSLGMGAMGLPGDLSSSSRFVRAAFMKLHSLSGPGEAESVSQIFHILGTVAQPRGCCRLEGGECEITAYTSCCNADRGIYYYTTYDEPAITGVDMHREDMDGTSPIRYPLCKETTIRIQNA